MNKNTEWCLDVVKEACAAFRSGHSEVVRDCIFDLMRSARELPEKDAKKLLAKVCYLEVK